MGCTSCTNKAQATSLYQQKQFTQEIVDENCEFTLEMLQAWKDKLLCFVNSDLYAEFGVDKKTINSYIGIVLSGINIYYNICYMAGKLNGVKPFITRLINSGKC